MPRLADDFVPAWGLSNGHAQTLFGALARRPRRLALERRRLETPDADFVDLDVLAGSASLPTVLVVHGLEGSSSSGYVQEVLAGCAARGWKAAALNLRSCSGEPNRQAASYSSGDIRDVTWLLERHLTGPVFMVGFSLGASVTLNALARAKPSNVRAAVAISTPFQLAKSAEYLDSGEAMARVYCGNFLLTMKRKALEKARRFPGTLDPTAIKAARTIRDFDHVVTARLFGFSSAEDYYARCSTGPLLADITTPTLLISAHDDALAPARYLPDDVQCSPALDVLVTQRGGHVGFVQGSMWAPTYWAEARALQWLEQRLTA